MTNRLFNLGGLALAVAPAICFTITYAIICAICFAVPAQAETERPNVLIIVADDVGYMDFGAYGGEAATPAIDGIAARARKCRAITHLRNVRPRAPCC